MTYFPVDANSKRCCSSQSFVTLLPKPTVSILVLKFLVVFSAICLVLFAAENQKVYAAGEEYSLRGHDLVLTIDTRWAGTANGGYYPVRIRVTNRGKPRNLTFRLRAYDNDLPTVQRTVGVQQNKTIQFTLAVPMVSDGTYGTLHISHNGRLLKGLDRQINLPEVNYSNSSRPALLVISSTNLDCNPFEQAVTSMVPTGSTSPYGGYYSGATEDHQVVSPTLLPDSWIGYSGVDIVAISLETLGKLSLNNRGAILDWVHQGGNLLVYDVKEPAEQSESLNRLLRLAAHRDIGERWEPANPAKRRFVKVPKVDEYGRVEAQAADEPEKKPDDAKETRKFVWQGHPNTFVRRNLMLGQISAFRDNPFPGSLHDWNWFLQSVGRQRYQWTTRNGISARRGTSEFLEFLIPGIEGVPVYAFLFLITVFTVAIGPVNYFLLLRRRQLYMLVVTIPVLAFVTSVSLFGYSAVAHGFGIKSRIRSLTVLDQGSQTAVTKSRVAIYAGLAPSEGLRFKPETAVYTIWPQNESFESGTVDWTETQVFQSGWLRSRTRTQFVLTTHRTERSRLEVKPAKSGKLPISNGLEWNLESLLVVDENGQLYVGNNIPAGSTAQLTAANESNLEVIKKQLGRHPLKAPDDITGDGTFNMFDGGYRNRVYGRLGYVQSSDANFSRSQMEQQIRSLQKSISNSNFSVTTPLTSNSYMAVLKENPGVDIGVTNTEERAGLHILVGSF